MNIREGIEHVVQNSSYVGINRTKLDEAAEQFEDREIDHWLRISPFAIEDLSDDEQLSFLCVLNAISFCYWGEPKWKVDYKGEVYDGAQGMIAALGRAIEEGTPILNAEYLSSIRQSELGRILQGNVEIPLLEERANILRDVGQAVAFVYGRSFSRLIDQSRGDANRLVDLLIEIFPSFEDSACYGGKRIQFNKRAQLLASDIHYGLNGTCKLDGIEKLTACADYKLPQVLRRFGIFEYCPELRRKIIALEEIDRGSEEEVEIRANTIKAVDLLTEKIRERYPHVTVPQVNDYLWLQGQIKLPNDEPYHRTRTTAY